MKVPSSPVCLCLFSLWTDLSGSRSFQWKPSWPQDGKNPSLLPGAHPPCPVPTLSGGNTLHILEVRPVQSLTWPTGNVRVKQEKWSSHSPNRLDLKEQNPSSRMKTQSEKGPCPRPLSGGLRSSFVPSYRVSKAASWGGGSTSRGLSPYQVPDTLLFNPLCRDAGAGVAHFR